jgi:hypothetical protein
MSTRKHVLLSLVIVGALAGLFLQRRCAAPASASTEQLWADRDAWTGKTVEVVGDLKEFGAGTADDHFVVEDKGYRVGVRGDARPAARTMVGTTVRARGVFVFTEKTGGYLESPELSLSDERR